MLFLALWPGPVSRSAAAVVQRSIDWPPSARLVPATGLHVLLHAVGAVPDDRVVSLVRALRVSSSRIEIQFDQLDVWDGDVAVLTAATTPAPLIDLHGRLGGALMAQGIELDGRPYRPHIRLARWAPVTPRRLRQNVTWHTKGYVLALSRDGVSTPVAKYVPE